MTSSVVPEAKVRKGAAVPAVLLACVFPGAGHLYLRRRDKGIVFLVCIGALFVLGLLMHSRLAMSLGLDDLLASLFSLAQMAIGVPYFAARALGFGAGNLDAVKHVTYEYGNTFTAVAGLLNVLVVLDAYDTAVGRKP